MLAAMVCGHLIGCVSPRVLVGIGLAKFAPGLRLSLLAAPARASDQLQDVDVGVA